MHGRRIGDLAEVTSRFFEVDGHGYAKPLSIFGLLVDLVQLDLALRVYKYGSIGAKVISHRALKVFHYVSGK